MNVLTLSRYLEPVLIRNPVIQRCLQTSCFHGLKYKRTNVTSSFTNIHGLSVNVCPVFHSRLFSNDMKNTVNTCPSNDVNTNNLKEGQSSDVPKNLPKGHVEYVFKPIYGFKYIAGAKAIAQLKLGQTLLTIFLIPCSTYLYIAGHGSPYFIGACLGLSSLAAVMLYVMSEFAQRIIGIIRVNEDMSGVMISHLSFWGKRLDEVYKTKDIVPFTDMGEDTKTKMEIYRKMTFYTNKKTFYLFIPGGKVLDKEIFESIFGNLE